jgi:hypothetical protein
MGRPSLKQQEIETRYNMVIWRAIKCAGGFSAVARRLEVSEATPRAWARLPGHVPEQEQRETICEMGGWVFKPSQLTSRQETSE